MLYVDLQSEVKGTVVHISTDLIMAYVKIKL
jgi:hypothetical protein